MKRYRILKPLVLSFTTPQDQYDTWIRPEDNITLEANEHTIWTIKDRVCHESITTANAIDHWLADGLIEEIQPKEV